MNEHSSDSKNKSSDPPAPEVLKPQDGHKTESVAASSSVVQDSDKKQKASFKLHHGTYRPSHRATFIGIAVVAVILIINAVVIFFVFKNQTTTNNGNQTDVSISSDILNQLGVNRTAVGDLGTELSIGPNTSFGGEVKVGGDVSVAGNLTLNGKISASDVSMSTLQAGDVTISAINVNGDGTVSNLNVRQGLVVAGATNFQGAVTMGSLLTVNNSANVSGNLSVGGTLLIGNFQTNTLTVGGHIITRGSAPSVTKGSALGPIDNVTISGNDAAGTVAVNIGTTTRSGTVANITFVNQYTNTPHIMITTVGPGAEGVYVNRSATGFSINVSSIVNGGHAFDYIVMQ